MSEKKLPRTQLLALKYLADHPEADYLSLREASKSRNSPKYIAERLRKRGLATTDDEKTYRITERGLEELKEEISTMNYEREQWEF